MAQPEDAIGQVRSSHIWLSSVTLTSRAKADLGSWQAVVEKDCFSKYWSIWLSVCPSLHVPVYAHAHHTARKTPLMLWMLQGKLQLCHLMKEVVGAATGLLPHYTIGTHQCWISAAIPCLTSPADDVHTEAMLRKIGKSVNHFIYYQESAGISLSNIRSPTENSMYKKYRQFLHHLTLPYL